MKTIWFKFCISMCLLFSIIFSVSAAAPPSYLEGYSLRNWLRSNYHSGKHNTMSYTNARKYLYNYIDNNNNRLYCIYSGYNKYWNYGGSGTNPNPLTCEHIVPQSFYGYNYPMKSDLHQLFPVLDRWNSIRSDHPFGEINDYRTTKWIYLDDEYNKKPFYNIDSYSEFVDGYFEPREDIKGNIARAIFYFYTMYPNQGTSIDDVGNLDELYQWHCQDEVDSTEISRNDSIEYYQGNRNPYIDNPELVHDAWQVGPNNCYAYQKPPTTGTPGGPTGPGSDLFFSEYIEGSSNNKAIEIANFTGERVNLSQYSIMKQANGSGYWSSKLQLSGYLDHGEVFVIANRYASSSIRNRADLQTSSDALSFNGNDPVGLFKNNKLIDVIGNYNNGSGYFANDVTMIRKSSIEAPSTYYDNDDWNNYSKDYHGDLGSHSID